MFSLVAQYVRYSLAGINGLQVVTCCSLVAQFVRYSLTGINGLQVVTCCSLAVQHPRNMHCVFQGWSCSVNCVCCHTEAELADQTCSLNQAQCNDSGQPV